MPFSWGLLYNKEMIRKQTILTKFISELSHSLLVVSDGPYFRKKKNETVGQSCELMRINHSGEVLAQALYRGASVSPTGKEKTISRFLIKAGKEEFHHLTLCKNRIIDLGGRVSLLNPVCYVAGFLIGYISGCFDRETVLGFIAETEEQVSEHLEEHYALLVENDKVSAAILAVLLKDERKHHSTAKKYGGGSIPFTAKQAMNTASKIWKRVTYYV